MWDFIRNIFKKEPPVVEEEMAITTEAKTTEIEYGAKEGMPENYWRELERPSDPLNQNPAEAIDKDPANIGRLGEASTKTGEEAIHSIDDRVKSIIEERGGVKNLDQNPSTKSLVENAGEEITNSPSSTITEIESTNAINTPEVKEENWIDDLIPDYGGGAGGGGGNTNGRIGADDLKGPQDEIDLDDDLSQNNQLQQNQLENISTADLEKDEIDQSGQISQSVSENDNIQLALNDLSTQPTIDDNTSSFDEISKEDFKAALNDVYSSIQEKDEIDQSGQTPLNPSENENVQLALNDFTSQPSIDDNTSSFDEISKEDFKAALNDVYSSIQEKDEVAEMTNDLSQEDFSTALADLNFDERRIKDDEGAPDRDNEENDEAFLEAMNDFDTTFKDDNIDSYYDDREYENNEDMDDMGMDGGSDGGGDG